MTQQKTCKSFGMAHGFRTRGPELEACSSESTPVVRLAAIDRITVAPRVDTARNVQANCSCRLKPGIVLKLSQHASNLHSSAAKL